MDSKEQLLAMRCVNVFLTQPKALIKSSLTTTRSNTRRVRARKARKS